jgi:hypothetical protein
MRGARRKSFIITLWAEPREPAWSPPGRDLSDTEIWRGYLESSSRERRYFSTLAQLNHLLIAAAQWRDPPDSP